MAKEWRLRGGAKREGDMEYIKRVRGQAAGLKGSVFGYMSNN